MTTFRSALLAALLLGGGCFPGSVWSQPGGVWETDMNRAIVTAQRENRDMLLLFTGSDWCPPCQKLEAETLSQADFLAGASKNWLLVKFDFLRNTPLSPELEQQNGDWSHRLGVTAFPTIVLVDSKQRPFGFQGYLEGGPVAMLEALRDLRGRRERRDDALAKAAAATGDERARRLDQALDALDPQLVQVWYADIVGQIVALDEDNHLGLRAKWNGERDAEARQVILADIQAIARLDRPDRAAAFIDEVLAAVQFPAVEKFEILRIKLGLLQQAGESGSAVALLDEMLAMPEISDATRERLIVKKAFQYFGQGNREEAVALLATAAGQSPQLYYVRLALAQLTHASGKPAEAVEMLKAAIVEATSAPDALVELVGTLADLQCLAGQETEALDALEQFAGNEQIPVDLRAEALLHAALIMREAGRTRPALLTENRAVSLSKTPELSRELQRVVDALRKPKVPDPAAGGTSPGGD